MSTKEQSGIQFVENINSDLKTLKTINLFNITIQPGLSHLRINGWVIGQYNWEIH